MVCRKGILNEIPLACSFRCSVLIDRCISTRFTDHKKNVKSKTQISEGSKHLLGCFNCFPLCAFFDFCMCACWLSFFLCDNIVYSLFIKEQTGGMEMLFLRLVTCITIKRRCVRGLCVCCSFMYLLYRGFCDMTYHQLVCIVSDALLRSGIGNYPVRPSIRIR